MAFFRYDNTVRSVVGLGLPGIDVAVLTQPADTTTEPGSPLATIWAASTSNAPVLTTASWANGFITFTLVSVPADVVIGAYLSIAGVTPTGYNGIWLINLVSGLDVQVTNIDGTLINPTPGLYVSGGTVATSALPNPFLTDNLGNLFFYAAAGIYTVQFYGSALPSQLVLADQNVVAGGGSGSVTSVGLSLPAEFSIAGSPITTTGTLAVTKANENANTVWSGPATGAPAQPAFRALVAADLPGGSGTVSSVALTATVPTDIITAGVVGSPVTTAGTLALTLTKVNQSANQVFAGGTSGGAAPPTFRALVAADLPTVGANTEIIFNDGGILSGDANLTWDKATGTLTASGTASLSGLASGSILNNFIQVQPTTVVMAADETGATGVFSSNASFTISSIASSISLVPSTKLHIALAAVHIFANNAAAITGGLAAGDLYRTGADPDTVCIVH